MIRTYDGALLTELANVPVMRALLGGEGDIDLVPAVADVRNYTFLSDVYKGGVMLAPLWPGAYEAHTINEVGASPRAILGFECEVRDYMFRCTDCEELYTKVLDDSKGAGWLTIHIGFQLVRERNGVSYWKLDLDTWARACSTTHEQGQSFHVLLESAKRAAGSALPAHPEDPDHDCAVGAAIQMIRSGNTIKGVNFYNKWAIFAGYGQITLLSEQPLMIDVQDAVMGLNDGEVEVLQCR